MKGWADYKSISYLRARQAVTLILRTKNNTFFVFFDEYLFLPIFGSSAPEAKDQKEISIFSSINQQESFLPRRRLDINREVNYTRAISLPIQEEK